MDHTFHLCKVQGEGDFCQSDCSKLQQNSLGEICSVKVRVQTLSKEHLYIQHFEGSSITILFNLNR